jgi:hypothetical protein
VAIELRDDGFSRGVASVPHRQRPALRDAGDPPRGASPTVTDGPVTKRERDPLRGMVVRRRGRRLRAGAPWTWSGLTVLLVCWGIWAVSLRGSSLLVPVIGLVLVLAVGALLFVVARLLGRAVLEQALGRERRTAWPSHMTVSIFLMLAGVAFLQQTEWIADSWRGIGDFWQWLVDGWNWILDLGRG